MAICTYNGEIVRMSVNLNDLFTFMTPWNKTTRWLQIYDKNVSMIMYVA